MRKPKGPYKFVAGYFDGYEVIGPGVDSPKMVLYAESAKEAEHVTRHLNIAYEAGRKKRGN